MYQEPHDAGLTWRVTPDMMCILDDQGCFFAVNPAWHRTLGWTSEEMVGKAYLDFLHPDDVDRSIAAFEVVRSGKPVLRFENRYRGKDGAYYWFSWVAVPEGGKYYCTVRDVTDDKARLKIIEEQRAEAELREQFLAVLGHDLRNPLGAFSSGVRLMQKGPGEDRARLILKEMQSSVSRMSELVDNLMDLARVRLGDGIGLELKESSHFAEDLRQVAREIELVSEDIKVETDINITGTVRCDVPRIMQVVSNLLSNAVTHGDTSTPIRLEANNRDGYLHIAVVNSGDPIPEEVKVQLFQPFFRGGVRESQQGLGLGLYIAWEIAKAHDGTLSAMSGPKETRFTLDLPV